MLVCIIYNTYLSEQTYVYGQVISICAHVYDVAFWGNKVKNVTLGL